MKLITEEQYDHFKPDLIKEYNVLTYQLNRELSRFSRDEILFKYNRIRELVSLLGIGDNVQLDLFSMS